MKQLDIQGMTFFVREENYDDEYTVNEVIRDDCYQVDKNWFQGNTVIDIGSNIGDFSIMCAVKYGVKDVRAVEPEPHNLKVLEINNNINGGLVKIYPFALGKAGKTRIDDGSGHSQTGRITGSEVEVKDINEFLSDIEKIDLLKCDCEGGEYEIFEEISDLNLKKIEVVVGELHSWRWEEDPERHKKMIERLEKFFDLTYWGYLDSSFKGVKCTTK